jgi:5'-AMP-activated protein kinase catalytic alpha subunit
MKLLIDLSKSLKVAMRVNKNKKIGQYILGKSIGEGTFGKVKQGMHILTGEKVAVKILEKDKIQDVADVERVAREIHILKIVRHPNVVQLYEIIETQKQLYLIMEFANGGELFDFIVEQQRVDEREACMFFQQIIAGVEYISKLGIVHRDLKPENLLLDQKNKIKLVDFGLSNTYKPGETLKTACGSPWYAAPEMIAGKRYIGTNVDIWSCGVILFAMIWGFLPFEDPNTSQLYKKILNAEYKIPSFVSKDGADILKGILETDSDKRLTIEQIRNHPWYKQNEEINYSGIIVGTDQIPVDEDLLNDLKPFDYDLDYSRKCIEANKHNHITASYNLLQKAKLRDGKMTIKDAYECKNDLTSLMKRHPRFQNLNHNMPEHLKVSSRGDQKPSSMPPKTRIPKDTEDDIDTLNQTINPDKLIPKQLKIDIETQKEIKSKRRTGSTGGIYN